MTEQELDRMMRRVLLDSLKAGEERDEDGQTPPFQESSRHRRQMRAMLANPIRWLHRRKRPVWRQAMRRAAVILLTCTVAFGGVMACSSTARAELVRWVMERYGNHIDFIYKGEQNLGPIPQYEISDLPEGFVETIRDTAPSSVSIVYENQAGDVIYFIYNFMHQGGATYYTLDEGDTVSNVMVNQMKGLFFESKSPENLNTLDWIDSDVNIQFSVDGCFTLEELLHMADSISLCKTPK